MRHVPAIDSTGLHALRDLVKRSRRDGSLVILSDVHAQPVVALERSGLYDEVGEENVHGNIDDALNRARAYLGLPAVQRPAFATARAPHASLAQGGTTSDIITGTVTGPDSQPLAGATVQATSRETQISLERTTDARGRFTIVFADGGGRYDLLVRYIGFAPAR